MPGTDTALFSQTPEVVVVDNRGLTVRNIRYQRHPDSLQNTDQRISRHRYDARGFLAQSTDPRLYELQQAANFSYLTSLSGQVLRSASVDAGIILNLNDSAGRPARSINAAGVIRNWQYQRAELPGHLLSIVENGRITDRFVWGGNTQAEKDRNLAGQCLRHYDTAGLMQTDSIALSGVALSLTQRLLAEENNANWQGENEAAWNALLAAESFITLSTADASGLPLTTTDAMGNRQRQAYTVAGQLHNSWLTLKGATEQVIVKSLTYSASGQKLREEHGNGVVTSYSYQPETQRLSAIKTARPAGHPAGARVLQDLRYQYDPVGNVLRIINDAEATRFWRNEKVVPENSYGYDSLYQLVSASGREMATLSRQSITPPSASVPLPADSSAFAAYTRSYLYDRGGNLTRIRHNAPASGNNYTTDITVSTRSNRALLSSLTAEPAQVDAFFTAGGQQTRLQPGQSLNWTARGELLQVTPVVRDGQPADHESYRYNSDSQRIIKTSVQKTGNSTQTRHALWLPRIELRSRYSGENLSEALQVISVGEAGRAQVRVLHWLTGKPDGISNNQLRYSYDNLVHSSELELDADGNIISQEEYYPYGGTAVWNARSQPEADYKAIRYAGKERDASGLYYYGYRYYQPWAGRWLSADPAGTVDGLNLFRMVRNNPLTLTDNNGKAPVYPASAEEKPTEVVSTSASMAQQPEGGVAGAGRQTIFPRLTSVVQTENIMNREFHYAIHQLSARFKLVTDVVAQGEQLIITAHADYAPWSGDVTIPPGVTVKFLNPHNSYLTDIDIRDVVLGADKTFVSVSSAGAEPATREAHALLAEGGLLPLTGSATPGKVRNYRLAKFRMDTIGMVAEALHASRNYASRGIALKSDFLLIRGRMDIRGIFINPTLQEIFDALEANNIKYTNIVAAFCRGGAFKPNKSFDPKRPA